MREEEPKFDCPPIFHGVFNTEKRGVLAGADGEKITGVGGEAVVSDLESVVDGARLVGKTVDAGGEDNPSDIKNKPISEVDSDRDLVEKNLEIIFQNFPGKRIYRTGNINESAMGNRMDLSQGPRDYTYVVPNSNFDGLEKYFDNTVPGLSIDTVGMNFSRKTGLDRDYLKDGKKEGFSRCLVVGGKEYNINFFRLYDGVKVDNKQTDNDREDKELPLAA